MTPLPEWAPNIHPIVVHFPIALLVVAVFLDAATLFLKEQVGVRSTAVTLFALGALAAITAFFTGRAAADGVLLPVEAQTTLTDHENLAEMTAWFFGVYAIIRLSLVSLVHKGRLTLTRWSNAFIFLVGAGGLILLALTGDRGARMVFKYGVGVQAVPQENMVEHDHSVDHGDDEGEDHAADHEADEEASHGTDHEEAHEQGAGSGLDESVSGINASTLTSEGSWNWSAGQGTPDAIDGLFLYLAGSDDNLEFLEPDSLLSIRLEGEPLFMVSGGNLSSFQADVWLNLDQFEGSARLAHHVQDTNNYDFLEIKVGGVRLGRVKEGVVEIFDEANLQARGWIAMRVVTDGEHFRGYIGDDVAVHGHGDVPEPGRTGLRFDGEGTVQLKSIKVETLR